MTGTAFLKQIEVCNAGQEFVNGWGICFLVVGAVFVGVVWFSLEVMLSMALILCFLLFFGLFN